MSDRIPPHSLPAEMSVLGGILIAPSQLDEVGDLAVADFFLPAHQRILEAMRELAADGKAVDIVLLADALKLRGVLGSLEGGPLYLTRIANETPALGNIGHYAQIVREKAVLRRLIMACSDVMSTAYGDVSGVADFLAEARAKLAGVELADGSGPTPIGDEILPTLAAIEDRVRAPQAHFLRTGLQSFDHAIGGLRGGNLITIAARPGQGKSAWALDILLYAAEVNRVPGLLFSYEMTKLDIVERALAKRASVNGRNIITGEISRDDWESLHTASNQLAELPISLDTRPMSVERICSEARRWYAKQRRGLEPSQRKLAVVCVDYIGLIESSRDEQNRAIEIGKMTRALKNLAAELDIPVIAISQLNRESAKAQRKPMISDLRDSGAVEQDSNMILFPYWEGVPPSVGRHPATIIVGKNRGGPVGEVEVDWEAPYVRFVDQNRNYRETRYADAD